MVKIQRIIVEGTRLPTLSVIRLAQVKAGDRVNFVKLHGAMQKVTQSGLISNIDFEYESTPDKETDVILRLYSHWIAKYMESHGDPNFMEKFAVLADASSASGGIVTDRLIFKVVRCRAEVMGMSSGLFGFQPRLLEQLPKGSEALITLHCRSDGAVPVDHYVSR
jgi:hypothetical protein